MFLTIPLKTSPRYDLQSPLSNWLNDEEEVSYNDIGTDDDDNPLPWIVPKPEFKSWDCYEDLMRLQSLRHCLSESIKKSHTHKAALDEQALEDSQEYHAALLEFEKRGFPTSDVEQKPETTMNLAWAGAFLPSSLEVHHSLVWERACVLWNVAALESSLAATTTDFKSRDGCKQTIQHCQTAASLLSTLQELVNGATLDFATVDFSTPMLQFWQTVMKAQAQFTIYKMASLSEKQEPQHHSLLSKLLVATVPLYNQALTITQQEGRLQSEVPDQATEWGTHVKGQSLLCLAKSHYHVAVSHRLAQEWGAEVACLQKCCEILQECQTFLKTLNEPPSTPAQRETKVLVDFCRDRLQRAVDDNTEIYRDDIPTELPDLVAQQKLLAKDNLGLPTPMMVPKVKLFQTIGR